MSQKMVRIVCGIVAVAITLPIIISVISMLVM